MAHEEQHVSPDGLLRLRVLFADDGEVTIGFDGFRWHTHGELLTGDYGSTPEQAARAFVKAILAGSEVIELFMDSGRLIDVSIREKPLLADAEILPGEEILLRYWDGTIHQRADR
ncbi:hypothetical protein [Bosea sp. (in: a-proteobacteria)]|jgi:hypothetical protein|uniref:hypothetical protein n=1 Tax=Bosea sp. (in: a-proteobacteria) TaxID=1871050 RepID=UPI003F71C42D